VYQEENNLRPNLWDPLGVGPLVLESAGAGGSVDRVVVISFFVPEATVLESRFDSFLRADLDGGRITCDAFNGTGWHPDVLSGGRNTSSGSAVMKWIVWSSRLVEGVEP